jgi:two-component system KDP operon response regulator KdpE
VNGQPAPVAVVIEDEATIRRFLRTALEEEGLRVVEAGDAEHGLRELATRHPDLVIVDLGLPDRDGVEVIRDLRGWSDIPVIVLSARSTEPEKVVALDAGADDYLTKPFGVGELLARVRAQLRRRARLGADASAQVAFGDVRVDLALRTVERQGAPIHLTPIEYRLLGIFIANAGKVLTHRFLLNQVWGPNAVESNHYLRVYVGHLRQKLEADPTQPRHFLTEIGVGYRFLL